MCVAQLMGGAAEGKAGEADWSSMRNTSEKVEGGEGADLQSSSMWLKSLTSVQPQQERDKVVPEQEAEFSR